MITTVVPTLGTRPTWLAATLESLLNQAGVQAQVLVVGPGGTAADDVCQRLGIDHLAFGGGLAAAINHGFHRATSEYVAWLGDDDLLAPGSLAATSQALDRCPLASFAYGQLRYIDEHGRTLWLARPGRLASWYIAHGKNLVPQPGSLFRRTAVESVGYVNEGLKNSMDQDLFQRLLKQGPAVYLAQELASYRMHTGTITATKGVTDESEQVRVAHAERERRYRMLRRVTRRTDRLLHGAQRRLPARPAPLLQDGRPYHVLASS